MRLQMWAYMSCILIGARTFACRDALGIFDFTLGFFISCKHNYYTKIQNYVTQFKAGHIANISFCSTLYLLTHGKSLNAKVCYKRRRTPPMHCLADFVISRRSKITRSEHKVIDSHAPNLISFQINALLLIKQFNSLYNQ